MTPLRIVFPRAWCRTDCNAVSDSKIGSPTQNSEPHRLPKGTLHAAQRCSRIVISFLRETELADSRWKDANIDLLGWGPSDQFSAYQPRLTPDLTQQPTLPPQLEFREVVQILQLLREVRNEYCWQMQSPISLKRLTGRVLTSMQKQPLRHTRTKDLPLFCCESNCKQY